jgi:hypothetical protein
MEVTYYELIICSYLIECENPFWEHFKFVLTLHDLRKLFLLDWLQPKVVRRFSLGQVYLQNF